MKDSTFKGWMLVAVIATLAILVFFVAMPGGMVKQTIIQTGGTSEDPTNVSNTLLTGKAGTVTVKDYDRANDDKNTEVAASWYVFDNGKLVTNAAAVTSIDTSVGSPLVFYGTGTTYYGDKKEYSLDGISTGTVDLDAYTIAAESSMSVTGYDRTGATALTADDDDENTADYSITLGSGESVPYHLQLRNGDDESLYKLKAICTFHANGVNITENKLVDSDFTEVAIPLQLKNAVISINNDTASNAFYSYYKHCYVYKAGTDETINLKGWDDTKLFKFVVSATSGYNPAPNMGNNFGAIFLDASYTLGNDGKIWFDFYTHDSNEYVDTIGLAETEASPQGLQIGAAIEAL